MKNHTKIGEIMTAELRTVKPNTSLAQIKEIFKQNDFHHLPVKDDLGEISGIISSIDISRSTHFPQPMSQLEARHIMTVSLETVKTDTSVEDALDMFLDRKIRALPVLDERNVFVGLVTTYDLLSLYKKEMTA